MAAQLMPSDHPEVPKDVCPASSGTILEYASPMCPDYRVYLNCDPLQPVITGDPSEAQARLLLQEVERVLLESFWTKVLCRDSPYVKGLPFALASWKKGSTLIQVSALKETLLARGKSGSTELSTSDYFKSLTLEELKAGIQALQPTNIEGALRLLTVIGKQRLNALPLWPSLPNPYKFDLLVAELIRQLTSDSSAGSRSAAMAMVAMRSTLWLVLPVEAAARITFLAGVARKSENPWDNPLAFLGTELTALVQELTPQSAAKGEMKKKDNCLPSYAVLRTNIRNRGDFSWPLAGELLKERDHSADIRGRWRTTCRETSLATLSNRNSAGVTTGAAGESNRIGVRNWEKTDEVQPDEEVQVEFYPVTHINDASILLNIDDNRPVILEAVSRAEVWGALQAVERGYIGGFWDAIVDVSVYDNQLPYALAATAQGHAMMSPITVYEKLTGHGDVNGREALESLRRYPCAQIQSAVRQLQPNDIVGALDLLNENGRLRFKGFSLLQRATESSSFHSFVVSLIETATQSGHFTGKELAQQSLISLRAKQWIVLPSVVNRHIGVVLRGIRAKGLLDHSWRSDPMNALTGPIKELFESLLKETSTAREFSGKVHSVESLCRHAVLCTSLRSASELTIPLIDKLFDSSAVSGSDVGATRDRWLRICKAACPNVTSLEARQSESGDRKKGGLSPSDEVKTAFYPVPNNNEDRIVPNVDDKRPVVLETVSTTGIVAKARCRTESRDQKKIGKLQLDDDVQTETYPAPHDNEARIVLNVDDKRPVILEAVGSAETCEALKAIEKEYVNEFWNAIAEVSVYDDQFPYALAATAEKHTLISPIAVHEALTGYGDVNGREALESLRRYPCAEIQFAVRRLQPKEILGALDLLNENGRIRFSGFSLLQRAEECSDFPSLVVSLIETATESGHATGKALAMQALIALRAKHWIVLPVIVNRHISSVLRGIHANGSSDHSWRSDPMNALTGPIRELFDSLLNETSEPTKDRTQTIADDDKTSSLQSLCRLAVLCTSMRSQSDLTMPLVLKLQSTSRASDSAAAIFRDTCRRICELSGPEAIISEQGEPNDHKEALSSRCEHDPRLVEWIDVLELQCKKHTAGNMEPLYQSFAVWLNWLRMLTEIPSPCEVRRDHIVGEACSPTSFLNHISGLPVMEGQKNLILKKISDVFEDLVTDREGTNHVINNPIRYERDRFARPRYESRDSTTRSRIEDLVLEDLKNTIVVAVKSGNDGSKNSRPKQAIEGGTGGDLCSAEDQKFEWGPELRKIKYIHNKQGKMCPILPAILYLMLVFPLRAHQVRWLDSGEMDEYVYTYEDRCFVANNNAFIKGRQSGVIQAADGNPRQDIDHLLDFLVAVNKTALSERIRSAFTISYLPPDVLWVLRQVAEYQQQFGPRAHLVKEVHEPVNRKRRNTALARFYPDICPLFRYSRQKSFYPPAHKQIAYFWDKLCRVWDVKNAAWIDPTTGKTRMRPGVPTLSKKYVGPEGDTRFVARYDIHSLRVAGVSKLLDAGLPLGVVASISGHKSLAMCLYYYRADQAALRLKLHEAFKKLGNSAGIAEIAERLKQSDDEAGFRGSPDALAKLRAARKTGLMSITTSGVCPGASCSDGLASELYQIGGMDVPGAKCPLCRFYVYGPAFLPGLVYDYNCLLFELQAKAEQQVDIRSAAIRAEDDGQDGEVWRLRGEDARLDRETCLDVAVLARLYEIIDECVNLLNDQPDTPVKTALVVQQDRLGIAIEEVSKFDKLKNLVEVAHVMPSTRHSTPKLAELELKDLLMGLLRRNGAECYLAGLPKEASTKATLQLARLLESVVPSDDLRQKLLDGVIAIRDIPTLEGSLAVHMSETNRALQQPAVAD